MRSGLNDKWVAPATIQSTPPNRAGHRAPAPSRVPTIELSNWLMRWLARTNPGVRGLLPQLGKVMDATSAKAITTLGWHPRPLETSIIQTARSLLDLSHQH